MGYVKPAQQLSLVFLFTKSIFRNNIKLLRRYLILRTKKRYHNLTMNKLCQIISYYNILLQNFRGLPATTDLTFTNCITGIWFNSSIISRLQTLSSCNRIVVLLEKSFPGTGYLQETVCWIIIYFIAIKLKKIIIKCHARQLRMANNSNCLLS